MAPNIKVSKALSAMREIGIAEETVKPVLKNLLKLYDKKWELIEEENYRALADAIFECEENKAEEGKKVNEDPEPPLKRLRLKHQDQVSPSSVGNSGSLSGQSSLKRPKLEENPIEISPNRPSQLFPRDKTAEHEAVSPEMHLRDKRKECTSPLNRPRPERAQPSQTEMVLSPQSFPRQQREEQLYPCPGSSRTESVISVSPQAHFRDKGKEPISSQISSREKRPVSKGSSRICFKELKVQPGIVLSHSEKFPSSRHANALIKPKMEPLTDDLPQLEVPNAVIHPLDLGPRRNGDPIRKDFNSVGSDSTSKKDGEEPMVSQNANGKYEGDDGSYSASKTSKSLEIANTPECSSIDFEIASSPLGEVKVSLSCNSTLGRSNFHMPSLDTVLKMVEDRCLRSYKIIEPKFSLMKLMKELCQCVLDAGSDSVDENGEKVTTVTPSIDSLKKSCIRNVLGSKGSYQGNFNIPPNFCSSSKVVIPKIPRLMQMDGLGDLHRFIQPNQKVTGRTVGEKIKNKDLTSSQCSNSRSLVVYQPTRSILDDIRPLHDVNDLSKGEERVRISLINEISSEPYPPSFYYIPQNIVYQDAYINFSLARIGDEDCCSKCFGDCMSSPIPCACARETGGEFAYTVEGRVNRKFLDECISMIRDPQKNRLFYCHDCPLERSKPCKGHLVRKFIKECWSKCGCSKQCGNRVVQRGITCNLQVFLTPEEKGWGLRTLKDLPRGTFVCEYVGEILTNTELYERNIRSTGNERHTYPVLLDADWGSEGVLKDEEALCLDATHYGNVARFINHRCWDANLIEIPVEIETPDHHYYHIAFFTTRNVDAFEELTWDYGIDFEDHNHPIKAFHCCCGSKGCRCKKHTESTKSNAIVLC